MIKIRDIKAAPKKRFNLAAQVKKLGQDSLLPQTRAQYLSGKTIEASKPWVELGMSRRTWYRRRKEKESK